MWATLGPVDPSRLLVMGIAGIDSNALFHARATGADSAVSGTVALLGAATALAQLDSSVLATFDKQLAFGFFQGESWGYLGSKRFVQEVQAFSCQKKSGDNACAEPYKYSLAFTNMSLSRIAALLEAKQVGAAQADQLYFHTEAGQVGNPADILATLQEVAQEIQIQASVYPAGAQGIPPSSTHSFLLARPEIPAVVVTDHAATYANTFYDSDFDGFSNLNPEMVCNAATLLARTMYDLAASSSTPGPGDLAVDCELVFELLDCLVKNISCDLANELLGFTGASQYSKYVGVFDWLYGIEITSKFIHDFLVPIVAYDYSEEDTCNAKNACPDNQICINTTCYSSSVYYHDAFSTAFEYGYGDSEWKIVDSSQPLYSES